MKERITEISVSEYEGDVYNLEVDPIHPVEDDQYYIDDNTGIVIHNCHPRDNIAMSFIARKLNLSHDFFEDIMKTREDQTEFLAELMLQHNGPYYVMGKTFKEETNLTVGSPAILLYNVLREKGVTVTHYDPWIDETAPNFEKGTYLVATRHDSFKDFVFPSGSTVIDVWRYLDLRDRDDIEHIKVGIGK